MNSLLYESVTIAGLLTLALADASLFLVTFPRNGGHVVDFIFATLGFVTALVGGILWTRSMELRLLARIAMGCAGMVALGVYVISGLAIARSMLFDSTAALVLVGLFGFPLVAAPFVLDWFPTHTRALQISFAVALLVYLVGFIVRSVAHAVAGTVVEFLAFAGLTSVYAFSRYLRGTQPLVKAAEFSYGATA
jgi:hypothetical protein